MPDYHINDLEEQLRQDRRLGKARRRKRRLRKLLPVFLLLFLAVGIFLVIRFIGHEEETEVPSTLAPGSSVVTLNFVGDISLSEEMQKSFQTGSDYDFTPLLQRVIPRLASADLTIGNLEGNIVDAGSVSAHNYPAELLRDLYNAGFDLLQTRRDLFAAGTGVIALVEHIRHFRIIGKALSGRGRNDKPP